MRCCGGVDGGKYDGATGVWDVVVGTVTCQQAVRHKGHTFEHFHHDEPRITIAHQLENTHEVWMAYLTDRPKLSLKMQQRLRMRIFEHFDRNALRTFFVPCIEDASEGARAEHSDQAITVGEQIARDGHAVRCGPITVLHIGLCVCA